MEREVRGDAEAEQCSEPVLRLESHGDDLGDERHVEKQQQSRPQEPPFFGHHGEDEVGVVLGQEPELGLGPMEEPLTYEPPRPHGDLGLDGMVAAAQGIPGGIQEGENPQPLVAFQGKPQKRETGKEESADGQERGASDTQQQEHPGGDEGDDAGSAQVRLEKNQ